MQQLRNLLADAWNFVLDLFTWEAMPEPTRCANCPPEGLCPECEMEWWERG